MPNPYKEKTSVKLRTFIGAAAAAVALSANCETVKWLYDASKGTSPTSPALFTDASNWEDEQGVNRVPTTGDFINLTDATNRYIRLDTDITLKQFRGCSSGYPKIIGSGSITFTSVSAAVQENIDGRYATFFVPVETLNTLANAYTHFGNLSMAADLEVKKPFQTF